MSVVISTFQRRDALRRALDSLVSQRVPPDLHYEVIAVDNNSTDGTRETIADYVRRFPDRVRYAFEPRQGVSFGRNAGIHAARAPVVAFTDDDNVVSRNWIVTIASQFRDHPDVAGVGGKVLPEWSQTPPGWLDRRHWSPLAILDYGERPFCTSSRRPLCLLTANLAFRREVLVRVGGFSPSFPRCQDHELLLRLWRRGERILYAPELVTFAPVDIRRTTPAYHRQWHATHGHYAALMRLEEATDGCGQLRAHPPAAARLFGSPGYVYTDVVRQGGRWLMSVGRGDRSRAAHHEYLIRYLVAYIRHTAILSRSVREGPARDVVRFIRTLVHRRATAVNMAPVRLAAAHVVIAAMISGSAWDIATGREHWPFSPYPMFSGVEQAATLDSLLIRGVPAEPDGHEFTLREPAQIAPFDQCRLNTAMQRADSLDDGGATLHAMLEDSLARYEAQRARGSHDGPRLRAVRVYRAHWTLDADAMNVDAPDAVDLIDEADAAPGQIAKAGR